MNERNYVLMIATKSDLKHPLFWGSLTNDNQERSYGGYTPYVEQAELYSKDEIMLHFFGTKEERSFPVDAVNVRLYQYTPENWAEYGESMGVFIIPRSNVVNQTERIFGN